MQGFTISAQCSAWQWETNDSCLCRSKQHNVDVNQQYNKSLEQGEGTTRTNSHQLAVIQFSLMYCSLEMVLLMLDITHQKFIVKINLIILNGSYEITGSLAKPELAVLIK